MKNQSKTGSASTSSSRTLKSAKKPNEPQIELPASKPEGRMPGSIDDKRAIIAGLMTVINLLPKHLTPQQAEQVQAIEYGLIARTQRLREQFELEEADIKIQQMEKLIALIKYV